MPSRAGLAPACWATGFKAGTPWSWNARRSRGRGYATATIELPVEKMRGYVVQFSARIKAENVSRKPQPYNGVKFMAPIVTDQEKTWPAAEMRRRHVRLAEGRLPGHHPRGRQASQPGRGPGSGHGQGLVRRHPRRRLEAAGGRTGRAWRPARCTRGTTCRGCAGRWSAPTSTTRASACLGQEWNANLIRWQLVRREKFDDPLDLAAYDRWLQSALKQLDAALPLCEKYGLRVVVDLHSPPGGQRLGGGYAGSDHGLFTDAACQRKFVEVWQHMARRYKDSKAIWGYDLANEPVEAAAGEELADWQDLAERAAKAIRAIDPERAIIVEPPEWGNPAGTARASAAGSSERRLQRPHVPAARLHAPGRVSGPARRTAIPARSTASDGTRPSLKRR